MNDLDHIELEEWRASLDEVLARRGQTQVQRILDTIRVRAAESGVKLPAQVQTPYINTIALADEPEYPGDLEIERKITGVLRWNAMAMVTRANRRSNGIGGHISTYASSAVMYEVAFNHFFRGKREGFSGDDVFIQGHGSPGIYARAFLEGRLSEKAIDQFRRSTRGGVESYPHPYLMPEFWQFPTVSMGLNTMMAIYQARFQKYLEARGLKPAAGEKVWAFLGDGEMDEPESLGAITVATREGLDNLICVVNCNLQRLDGPVRGNGKIVQELEGVFRGAGWDVLKVMWGSSWDELFRRDHDGVLARRLTGLLDGDLQKCVTDGGAYVREKIFGGDARLEELARGMSDAELHALVLDRGGHDYRKVHAAYAKAVKAERPTLILMHTVKGYGLGQAGEGKNTAHQTKKLDAEAMKAFAKRFEVQVPEDRVGDAPFLKFSEGSPELNYLKARRAELGGFVPERKVVERPLTLGDAKLFDEFDQGSGGRELSTTMVFVRLLSKLLKDPNLGKHVVPIVPDEARTFGMEGLFRSAGIYSPKGQLYTPVDADSLMYYKEAKDGQVLQEGINEGGAMCSWTSAATAYANFDLPMIPFYIYYSMFGVPRVGDIVWAASDMQARGFLIGGTAGRTTLAGEGLQHQDGHNTLMFSAFPNARVYDPAYAYEMAVIIKEGLRRMLGKNENVFYYITAMNENYAQPAMPEGAAQGILKGMYRLKRSEKTGSLRAQLFGSGTILNEALEAQKLLARFDVAADVWSVPSYTELRREALEVERWNRLHPDRKPRVSYVEETLRDLPGVFVHASDYMKAMPDLIQRWSPKPFETLGTDGFGRSEDRASLRRFFEVDAASIAAAALAGLARDGKVAPEVVAKAMQEWGIDPEKADPARS